MDTEILQTLLLDRTTGRNIIWATAEHSTREIQLADVDSIRPRHEKNRADQKSRTRARAEIFTPPEVCRLQNDLIAAPFDKQPWQEFIDAKFLEITCGEAPYITSRYNAVTGAPIPFAERGGLLDRKLRIVAEETSAVADRLELVTRAVKSIYGYEFQGDNLFLARRNVFDTVSEFFRDELRLKPPENFLPHVAEIISWNLWQMDGLKFTIPYADANPQGSLFDAAPPPKPPTEIYCKIMDWSTEKPTEFRKLIGRARR